MIGVEYDRAQENEAWDLARTAAQDVYTRQSDIQIFPFARSEFEEFRTSLSHSACQVQRCGLIVSGDARKR